MTSGDGPLLYLSRSDVESLGISMPEIIAVVEAMFREKGEGRVEMPPKPGIHTRPDAFIHAMPTWIPALGAAGVKWVSGYPENQSRGLPYVTGLLILNDPETGVPIAVMDCTWITAQRTGAATAVAAKYLARADSASIGIIACGVQGRSNLEALSHVLPVRRVMAYDIDPSIAARFAESESRRSGLDVRAVSNPREAVSGLHVVVTSGPIIRTPKPVIDAGWLDPGAFACPLDFDSYFTGAAFAEADRITTDDLGQLAHYRHDGYFQSTPEPDSDLGAIVAGRASGRTADDQRIIAIHLGIAGCDMALARLVFDRAIEAGVGLRLPL